MKVYGWIQVVLGLLAIGSGAMALRGMLRDMLSGHRVVRFLECSLIASLACLLPLTRHMLPIQGICMLSVYCAGGAVLAWRKFRLAGMWCPIFALSIVAVLYLNVVSVSIQVFHHSPSFAMVASEPGSHFKIAQFFLASAFAALGVLSVRHVQRTH